MAYDPDLGYDPDLLNDDEEDFAGLPQVAPQAPAIPATPQIPLPPQRAAVPAAQPLPPAVQPLPAPPPKIAPAAPIPRGPDPLAAAYAALDPTQQRAGALVPVALANVTRSNPASIPVPGAAPAPADGGLLGTILGALFGAPAAAQSPAPAAVTVPASAAPSAPAATPPQVAAGSDSNIPYSPPAAPGVKPIILSDGRTLDRPPGWDTMSPEQKNAWVDGNIGNAKNADGSSSVTAQPLPPVDRPIMLAGGRQVPRPPGWEGMDDDQRQAYLQRSVSGAPTAFDDRPITLNSGQKIPRPPGWDTMPEEAKSAYVDQAAQAGPLAKPNQLVPPLPSQIGYRPPPPPRQLTKDEMKVYPQSARSMAGPLPAGALTERGDQSSARSDLAAGYHSMVQGVGGMTLFGAIGNYQADAQSMETARQQLQEAQSRNADPREIAAHQADIDYWQGKMQEDVKLLGPAAKLIKAHNVGDRYPMAPAAQKMFEAKTFGEAAKAIWDNPYETMRTVVLRSLPAQAPQLGLTALGTAAGGLAGGAATTGMVSTSMEAGSEMLQALDAEKVDISDPKAIERFMSQPMNAERVITRVASKALVVGGADAAASILTAGLAKYVHPKTFAGKVGEQVLNTAGQAASGAGGEAASQVASGQQLQPGQILAEALGEIPGGAGEFVIARKFLADHPEVAAEMPRAAEEHFGPPEQQGPREAQGPGDQLGPKQPRPVMQTGDFSETSLAGARSGQQAQAAKAGSLYDDFLAQRQQEQQRQSILAEGGKAGQQAQAARAGAQATLLNPQAGVAGREAQAANAGQRFDVIDEGSRAGQQAQAGAAGSGFNAAQGATGGEVAASGRTSGGFTPQENVDTKNLSPTMQTVVGVLSQDFQRQGIPARINSGFRDQDHNRRVGGAGDSAHTRGNAIDIDLKGMTEEQQRATIQTVLANPNVRGFGFYPNSNTIHIDTDEKNHPTRMAWGSDYHQRSVGQGWPAWMTEQVNAWRSTANTTPLGSIPEGSNTSQNIPPAGGRKPGGFAGLISRGEGGKAGYNALVYGKGTPTSIPLTDMTIAQVQEYQAGMRAAGHASSAVGEYQVIKGTLAGAVKALGLDPNTKFTPEVQDRIGAYLADQRGLSQWRRGLMSDQQFLNGLRQEWTSLKNVPDAEILQRAREGWVGGGSVEGGQPTSTTPATVDNVAAGEGVAQPPDVSTPAPALAPVEPAPSLQLPEPTRTQPANVNAADFPSGLQQNRVNTAAGPIEVKPQVMELDDVLSSERPGYDQSLQPRDRSRVASQAQVQRIAAQLDPQQLGHSTEADRGAPIVNEQGMVESGNGRTMALRQAYAQNGQQAENYRNYLRSQGFNIEGMRQPVLVRQRVTPLTPEQTQTFVQGANKPVALQMSASEQARSDAGNITPDMLAHLRNGTSSDPATNAGFRGAFMKSLSDEERGSLIDKDGALSKDGAARLRNAVMAHAYGESPSIQRAMESTDDNTRSLAGAMLDAAPNMANLRQRVANGEVDQSYDQSDNISEAVNRISEMREKGLTLDNYLAQQDAFNPISDDVQAWMRAFYSDTGKRQLSRERIADMMRFYSEEAAKTIPKGQGLDLGTESPSPRALLGYGRERATVNGEGSGNQGQLFGSGERGPVAAERRTGTGFQRGDEGSASRRQEVRGQGPDQVREFQADRGTGRPVDASNENRQGVETIEAKRKKRPPTQERDQFERASFSNRPSTQEDIWVAAGRDPADVRALPPDEQFKIASDQLKKDLGLADVERTPKSSSREAIDSLKDAYQGLRWMAHAMGFPALSMGLNKSFGMTLRKGARYLGAYYPKGRGSMEGLGPTKMPNVVLPTRSNSLAHEWGHALDWYLASKFDPMVAAKGTGSLSSFVADLKKRALAANSTFADPAMRKVGASWAQLMDTMMHDPATGQETEFYKNAKAVDVASGQPKPYFQTAHEMFARAFEAYMANRIEELGGQTAGVTKPDGLYAEGAHERFQKTFPKDADRQRIFAAMDQLMGDVAQTKDIVGTAAAIPGPGVSSPSLWEHAATAQNDTHASRLKDDFTKLAGLARGFQSGVSAIASSIAQPTTVGRENVRRAFYRLLNNPLRSVMGSLGALQMRSGSQALQTLMDHLGTSPGRDKPVNQTYEEARISKLRTFHNELSQAIRQFDLKRTTQAERDYLRTLLVSGGQHGAGPSKPIAVPAGVSTERAKQLRDAAGALRQLSDKMYYYGKDAGLDMHYARNGYLPRHILEEAVEQDGVGFRKAAAQAYGLVFDRDIAPDTKALMNEDYEDKPWSDFMEAAKGASARGSIARADYQALQKALRAAKELPNDKQRKADLQTALDAVFDDVKQDWSNDSAQHYHDAIMTPRRGSRMGSGAGGFLKGRTLTPEADMILKDYYEQDPLRLFHRYGTTITRRGEVQRRFGEGAHIVDELMARMAKEGLSKKEAETVGRMFDRIAGFEPRPFRSSTSNVLDAIQSLGQAGMLVHSLWSNVTEPWSIALRTGSITNGVKAFGLTAANLGNAARSLAGLGTFEGREYYRNLAQMVGAIADGAADEISGDRAAATFDAPEWVNKVVTTAHEKTGLAGLTRMQRATAVEMGAKILRDLSERHLKNPNDQEASLGLSELGIKKGQARDDFAKFMTEEFYDKNGDRIALNKLEGHDQYTPVQTALYRFAQQAVQEPGRADKPFMASGGLLGRGFFALQSFNYSMYRNIVHRAMVMMLSKDSGLTGPQRALMAAKGVPLMAATLTLHSLSALVAAELFGDEEKRKKVEKGWNDILNGNTATSEAKALLYTALGRSGMLGASESYLNLAAQTFGGNDYMGRYQVTPWKTMLGPVMGQIADSTGKILSTKGKTNTAAFTKDRAAFNLTTQLAGPIILNYLPGGPLTAGLAAQALTTRSNRDRIISGLTGRSIPAPPKKRD